MASFFSECLWVAIRRLDCHKGLTRVLHSLEKTSEQQSARVHISIFWRRTAEVNYLWENFINQTSIVIFCSFFPCRLAALSEGKDSSPNQRPLESLGSLKVDLIEVAKNYQSIAVEPTNEQGGATLRLKEELEVSISCFIIFWVGSLICFNFVISRQIHALTTGRYSVSVDVEFSSLAPTRPQVRTITNPAQSSSDSKSDETSHLTDEKCRQQAHLSVYLDSARVFIPVEDDGLKMGAIPLTSYSDESMIPIDSLKTDMVEWLFLLILFL